MPSMEDRGQTDRVTSTTRAGLRRCRCWASSSMRSGVISMPHSADSAPGCLQLMKISWNLKLLLEILEHPGI